MILYRIDKRGLRHQACWAHSVRHENITRSLRQECTGRSVQRMESSTDNVDFDSVDGSVRDT